MSCLMLHSNALYIDAIVFQAHREPRSEVHLPCGDLIVQGEQMNRTDF